MELRAITDLARLKASLIVGLVVIFGMTIASPEPTVNLYLIFGFTMGFLISASTNTINDIMDRDIDLFEKPNRPIPRKGISVNEAKILFSLETIVGLLLAFYLNLYSFLLSASVAILSVLYSWQLKNVLLIKNILTSFGISAALLVGVFATNPEKVSNEILLFFLLIFLAVVAFEMHKDIADVEGDGKENKNTIPVVFGTRMAALIVISLYLLGLILYHGILIITDYQFGLLFWGVEIIIFLVLFPLFNLINQHNDVEYVHKTRKFIMGPLALITISLVVNFLT
ncbi:MAG: UbiA family prenyltransferase [Candidatus Hodarchaeales archaeon]|jgi:geranylgeranylglycerol-phosphate geranylgeranyltransferase